MNHDQLKSCNKTLYHSLEQQSLPINLLLNPLRNNKKLADTPQLTFILPRYIQATALQTS